MDVLDQIDNALCKLPPSTGSWSCKWFRTIMYISVFLFAIGLTVVPGLAGVLATHIAVASAAYTLGHRR